MNLYEEFFAVVKVLSSPSAKVRYALVGGLSLAFHHRPRFTRDIDLLVHPDDFSLLEKSLTGLGYKQMAPGWRFKDSPLTLHRFLKPDDDDEMLVDVIVADADHCLIIDRALIAESEAGTVPVARKEDVVRMKQARSSKQDLADIEDLTRDEN